MITTRSLALCTFLSAILQLGAVAQSPYSVTTRVSVDPATGAQAQTWCAGPQVSDDGNLVTFITPSAVFDATDTNGSKDAYLLDIQANVVERVSLGSGGVQPDDRTDFASLSGDGRYVVFDNWSTNLVANDNNLVLDVYLRDRQTGLTQLISEGTSGLAGNASSFNPKVSQDGSFIVYASVASDLVAGDTNGKRDIFLYDRQLGTTELVSVSTAGVQGDDSSDGPSVSDDGRFVSFSSYATNLVASDTNGRTDVFVRDRQFGTTTRVSVSSSGQEGDHSSSDPSFSGDGSVVVFTSLASNLVTGDTLGTLDVFVHTLASHVTERVSVATFDDAANSHAWMASVSSDGRHVLFSSVSDLVPGDTNGSYDFFVHDRQLGITERVNIASDGAEALAGKTVVLSDISADGRVVVFESQASNLVSGDTNGDTDIFRHDRLTGGPELTLTNLVSGSTAQLSITGGTSGGAGFVVLGFSLVSPGPLPTAWGPMEVGNPANLLVLPLDAAGSLSLPVGLPLGLTGLKLYVQGVDIGLDFPTTPFHGEIQ